MSTITIAQLENQLKQLEGILTEEAISEIKGVYLALSEKNPEGFTLDQLQAALNENDNNRVATVGFLLFMLTTVAVGGILLGPSVAN